MQNRMRCWSLVLGLGCLLTTSSGWCILPPQPEPLIAPPIPVPLPPIPEPAPPPLPGLPIVWVLHEEDPDLGTSRFFIDLDTFNRELGDVKLGPGPGAGRRLIRTPDRGAIVVEDDALQKFSMSRSLFRLPLEGVRAADVNTTGLIYAVTEDSLMVIDAVGNVIDSTPGGGWDVVVDDEHGAVWVVGSDVRRHNMDLSEQWSIDPIGWSAVAVDVRPDGQAWVAESASLTRPVTGVNRFFRVTTGGSVRQPTALARPPSSIRVAGDGTLWVTSGPSVLQYSAGASFLTDKSFAPNVPLSIDVEFGGTVWVGSRLDVRSYDSLDLSMETTHHSFSESTRTWAVSPNEESEIATRLELDQDFTVLLTPDNPSWLFRVEPEAGRILEVTITDEEDDNYNAVYLGWDRIPGPHLHHAVADRPYEASQRLIVPFARNTVAFVRVQGFLFSAYNRVRIRARHREVALDSLSIERAGSRAQLLQARVRGAGFDASVDFTLKRRSGGGEEDPTSVRILGPTEAHLVFDASAMREGTYDFLARKRGDTATLERAFEKTDDENGPELVARLSGTNSHRFERTGRLTLEYSNLGNAEMPAPLFRVQGPSGVKLRLAEEETFAGDELFVLGVDPDGIAGVLPAGAQGRLTIVFETTRVLQCTAGDQSEGFELAVFSPRSNDPVPWEELARPEGLSAANWQSAAERLSEDYGVSSWGDYHKLLTELATKLSLRGRPAASLRAVFQQLLDELLGEPAAAITGVLRSSSTEAPLAAQPLEARRSGNKVACATTDHGGRFLFESLENGRSYTVVLPGGARATLAVPEAEDLNGAHILTDGFSLDPGDCELGDQRLHPPLSPADGLFDVLAHWCVTTLRSWDPNEKRGTEQGTQLRADTNQIRAGAWLRYSIYFENEADASANAQTIDIRDVLDCQRLDCSTFQLLGVSLGRDAYDFATGAVEAGLESTVCAASYDATSDGVSESLNPFAGLTYLRSTNATGNFEGPVCMELFYSVDVDPDTEDAAVRWMLQGETGDGADVGILPPNNADGRGEGRIDFLVQAKANLDGGTPILNEAEIRFDANPPIFTAPWQFVVGDFTPEEPHHPRPRSGSDVEAPTTPTLSWLSDGAEDFDLFVWPDGTDRPQQPTARGEVQDGFGAYSVAEPLASGQRYRWRVTVRNEHGRTIGNNWRFVARGEPPFRRCDANDDLEADISDASTILNFLFLGLGTAPTCIDALDCDDTGEVELTDAVFLLNYLFNAGRRPPQPLGECGDDTTADALSCVESACGD